MYSEHESCVDVVGLREGGVSRLCIGKSRARFSRLTSNGKRARVRGEGFDREQVLPKVWPNDLERGTVP